MKVILPSTYILDKKIHYSWRSPLIGIICISSWTGGLYWLYQSQNDLPSFIFIINGLILPIFTFYLIAQIKTRLFQKNEKFLIGFSGDNIIFPLRIPEKELPAEDNKYLLLNKIEIESIEITSKKVKNKHYRPGSKAAKTISISYIRFIINSEIQEELRECLLEANSAQGYTGSPTSIKQDHEINYDITGNTDRVNAIKKAIRSKFSTRLKN